MRGLFIGRFQPLHMGHISIMEHALSEADQLVVGIGSAERSYLPDDPFTAGERIEMLLRTASDMGWNERIIPIPLRDINRYSVWVSHVVSLCPPFDVVYSNNPLTRRLFTAAGYEVRGTPFADRDRYSGVNIRKLMKEGGDWGSLVPVPVEKYLSEINGVERVAESGKRDAP